MPRSRTSAREQEHARLLVEAFCRRFGAWAPAYRLLAQHAALPLILTPELVNYLRNHFLRGQVPWVAEADLLLSDLCQEVAYEQYVMDQDARDFLIEEMRRDPTLGEARMAEVARLLIGYVRALARSDRPSLSHELEAQQWAAMVFLDDQRDSAARQIAAAFSGVLGAGGAGRIDRAELARLANLTQALAPELSAHRQLLDYGRSVARLLGDVTGEAAADLERGGKLDAAVAVLGVGLPSLRALAPAPQREEKPASPRPGKEAIPPEVSTHDHLNYLDFDLEIGQAIGGGGRDYPLAVLQSPAGQAREMMRFPFDEMALENRLKELQIALLRSGGRRRTVSSDEERAVQEFGRALFDALLTGKVRNCYDVSQREARQQEMGLRLKLRIQAPELAVLPWEFLYDGRQGEYICLSRHTSIVRYLELPQPDQALAVTPPLRILGLIASPDGLPPLDVQQEKGRLEQAIAGLQARGLVELTWWEHATWRDLQKALRGAPWHILHFVGHGGFDKVADEGYIALADDEGQVSPLNATQLGRLLADQRSLRLAVLNACEGARGSERDIFSSTAATLIQHGIPAVLAMQYEISDRAAIEFMRGFYEALADGFPVDVAVAVARLAISMEVANTVEWGTPVLYMSSSDGLLFRFTEPAKPIAVEKPAVSEPTSRVKAASQPASPSTPPRQETAAPTIPHSPLSFDWVTIPAGEFLMGSDKAKDKDAYDDELPQHKVNVAAFRIARTPVTVAQFAAFVKATQHKTTAEMEGYSWNWNGKEWAKIEGAFWRQPRGPESNVRQKADHPVTCVSWDDALAFCQWAQVRLPTEAEWEKAARGADGRIYPWGNEAPDDQRGNFDMKVGDTTAVGSYPRGASPYGLLDMAGNVWEWTSSPFKPYPYKAGDGREDPQSKEGRVLRGGAFLLEALYVRCAFRFRSAPDLRFDGIGFRVVSPGL